MRTLLVESEVGLGTTVRAALEREGHDVVTCTDADGGPCRSIAAPGECPMEAHTDLAVLVTSRRGTRSLSEMGAVCAQRRRVPSIQVDPATVGDDFPSLASRATIAVRLTEASYAQAVRKHLPIGAAEVAVVRSPRKVTVHLGGFADDVDAQRKAFLVDKAREAVRLFDPHVAVIDVVAER